MTDMIVPTLLVLVQVIGAGCAFRAMRRARTAEGAVAWVVFLLAAPYIAVPVYLLVGSSRFHGYVAKRKALARVFDAIGRSAAGNSPPSAQTEVSPDGYVAAFRKLARMPVVSGNSATLLINGEAMFPAVLAAIDAARSYILVESYIIEDDRIGNVVKDHLIARARAGCRVFLLYDALGCYALSGSYLDALRDAGVAVLDFHRSRRLRTRLQLNFRNHRKIIVVDGEIGFVGGINIGDAYLGRDPAFGAWRDTHLGLRGPVVSQLQLVFAEDWHWASGDVLKLDWTPPPADAGADALIIAPSPADRMETGSLFFCNAIAMARQRVWIASPYFVPDKGILTALKLAALRGVDVRILVSHKPDNILTWLAAFSYFDEVREAGVKICQYSRGLLHQKVVVVDDGLAAVGTINLDNRSCSLNFEVATLVFDRAFTAEVATMLEADFDGSFVNETPLDRAGSPLLRYGVPVARLFAPLL